MSREILTLNKISPVGLSRLESRGYICGDDVKNPEAVLVRSASMHDMNLPASVQAIARAGAGVNNIPVDACGENGVVVFNTPGANANAVKELVLTGLLLSSRKVVDAIEWVKTVKDEPELSKLIEKGKSKFAGPEILGKKLGVIGLGAIGALVANSACALGMEVIGYDPFLSVKAALSLSPSVRFTDNIKDIFTSCDYITVHVPLLDSTKGMICKEALSSMKDGVRIMNFSRGGLVDDDDLLEAVESGKVACYVTDFPSGKLIGKNGIIAIPHLGASTPESEENCAVMAADEISDYLENGNITHSVNLPDLCAAKSTDRRVCVIHKNLPDALANISAAFSGAGVSVAALLSKSKKDLAYTIADVENGNADFASILGGIDGIIKVRVI